MARWAAVRIGPVRQGDRRHGGEPLPPSAGHATVGSAQPPADGEQPIAAIDRLDVIAMPVGQVNLREQGSISMNACRAAHHIPASTTDRYRPNEHQVGTATRFGEFVRRHTRRLLTRTIDPPLVEADAGQALMEKRGRISKVGRQLLRPPVVHPGFRAAFLHIDDVVAQLAQPRSGTACPPTRARPQGAARCCGEDDVHVQLPPGRRFFVSISAFDVSTFDF